MTIDQLSIRISNTAKSYYTQTSLSMAALDHTQSPPQQAADQYRALRLISICAFVPAVALLLPCGIITGRPVPALGIAPMFFSSAFSALMINGKPRLPKTTLCIHVFLAAFLIGVLVPR